MLVILEDFFFYFLLFFICFQGVLNKKKEKNQVKKYREEKFSIKGEKNWEVENFKENIKRDFNEKVKYPGK